MKTLTANISHAKAVAAIVLCSTFALTGCQPKEPGEGLVKYVKAKTFTLEDQIWLEAQIGLNPGNLTLPPLDLPIFDPNDPSHHFGRISIRQIVDGGSELAVAVNLTEATGIPGLAARLPNGQPIPFVGLENSIGIGIPVSRGSVVYVVVGEGIAMLGAAIGIKELDEIGSGLCPASLFFPFSFENPPITVSAGTYFGCEPSTSGLGVFVDLAGVFEGLSAKDAEAIGFSRAGVAAQVASDAGVMEVKPASRSVERRLHYRLWKLNQTRKTLHYQ